MDNPIEALNNLMGCIEVYLAAVSQGIPLKDLPPEIYKEFLNGTDTVKRLIQNIEPYKFQEFIDE